MAVGLELDIRGLQIAVDDPLLVRRLQSIGNLPRDGQRFVQWDRAFTDPIGECGPLDQFHHQVVRADVVDVQMLG